MGAEKRRESSPRRRVLPAGTSTQAATGASLQHPNVLQRHQAARVALSEETGLDLHSPWYPEVVQPVLQWVGASGGKTGSAVSEVRAFRGGAVF